MKTKQDWNALVDGLTQIGIVEPKALAEQLDRYGDLLLAENRKTNLVGAKSMRDLVPHLLDCLAPLVGTDLENPIVDVGTGGGLPGLVAAFAFPAKNFTLLEPRRKRSEFVATAVDVLGVRNATVSQATAQTASSAGLKGAFGTALARALAKPATAIQLTALLVRPGGRMILYIGTQAKPGDRELTQMSKSEMILEEARAVRVPYLDARRHVWLLRRTGSQ